jgi:16S rRNA (adenine1518-N6/adenine1519-N6)-dimethyltransferase
MKKSLGQVFLKDQNIIKKILESADISPKDSIVEIGCGEGWFSLSIAAINPNLYIYEIDEKYFEMAKERLKDFNTVKFIHKDVLKDDFAEVEAPKFKIIANIPYYISTKILKMIINAKDRVGQSTLMVQKEFAQKLIANPGDKLYTSLSIYTRFYLDIEYLFTVSKNCFRPIPKIDSAVISIKPRKQLPFQVNEDLFFACVRSAFWARRKKLLNCLEKSPYLNLKNSLKNRPEFEQYQNIRGETLSLEGFYKLFILLEPHLSLV